MQWHDDGDEVTSSKDERESVISGYERVNSGPFTVQLAVARLIFKDELDS